MTLGVVGFFLQNTLSLQPAADPDRGDALALSGLGPVGCAIDLHAFAEQRRELDAEPSLRMGKRLAATPYAAFAIDVVVVTGLVPAAGTAQEHVRVTKDAVDVTNDPSASPQALAALVGIVSLARRVQPFERWSHTRLISGSAVRTEPRSA